LTDVWQQLFEQQDITVICTIHFHSWLHENTPVRQSLETPTKTDMQEHVYQQPVRDVNELKQCLTEAWSATSRASLIKRLISGKIVLTRISKSKANFERSSNICYDMFLHNCHDF